MIGAVLQCSRRCTRNLAKRLNGRATKEAFMSAVQYLVEFRKECIQINRRSARPEIRDMVTPSSASGRFTGDERTKQGNDRQRKLDYQELCTHRENAGGVQD